jgi:hypothetical protein
LQRLLTFVIPAFFILALLAACKTATAHPPAATRGAPSGAALPVGTSGPAATPSSLIPPDVSALLHQYTLAKSDLPAGYTSGLIVEVPNEAAISGYSDLQAAQQEMDADGRQGGLGEQIIPPSDMPGSIGVSIELFKDTAGAQQWAAQPPALPASMNPTAASPSQSFGDAMSAIHWTQGGQSGYILSFSRGRLVFGIGTAAPTGQESLDAALALAQILDKKAQQQSN